MTRPRAVRRFVTSLLVASALMRPGGLRAQTDSSTTDRDRFRAPDDSTFRLTPRDWLARLPAVGEVSPLGMPMREFSNQPLVRYYAARLDIDW